MMNRVLITGGPGTGKTSLINELKRNGYNCSEEIVRKITLIKRKEGHKQYFLSKITFSACEIGCIVRPL